MSQPLKILHLEDNPLDAKMIQHILKRSGLQYEYVHADDRDTFLRQLSNTDPDIILADNELPQFSAAAALGIVQESGINIPLILVTGTVSEEYAVQMIKKGAADYILKDRLDRLPAAIDAALRQHTIELEKIQATALLQQSEEKYRNLVERVSDGFIAFDNDWNIIYANAVATVMLGNTYGKLTGFNFWKDLAYAGRDPFFNAFRKAMKTGRHAYVEEYVESLERWLQASLYPSANGLSVYFRDITSQKNMQEQLKEQEEQLELFIRHSPASIVMYDNNMKFLLASHRWFKENNLEEQDLWGRSHYDIFPHLPERWKAVHRRCLLGATEKNDQDFYVQPDGSVTTLRWEVLPWHKASGEIGGIIIFTEDITEKKRLEAELQEQQRKEQLRLTASVLDAQEKERNNIGIELHDNVNQILVGTKLLLSLLRKENGTSENLVDMAIDNLQQAIDENRRIAHELASPDFETKGLSSQLYQLFESMLVTAGMELDYDDSQLNNDCLNADQQLAVYRIAQEQCTNITKYAAATRVTVRLSSDEDLFNMQISDNGQGMSPDKKEKGIGLKNIKGRLSVFNGSATVTTAPGKGFSLEAMIPLQKKPVPAGLASA